MNNTGLDGQREVARSVSPVMTEPRSMIDLLRAETATHHDGLESGLRIEDRLSGGETRGPLIAAYFTFHRETEAALSPHLRDMPDLAFASRVGARQINPDPRRGTRSGNPVFPEIGTKAEALGAFYVSEGSTLGGRKILTTLRSRGVSTDDLHFLNPYGKDAAAHWRTFLEVLERETAHNQSTMKACVDGAIKAFAFAATCLREERTN
jgi:heme oxygenase (biliverdin-IX-beta and delta-forming)